VKRFPNIQKSSPCFVIFVVRLDSSHSNSIRYNTFKCSYIQATTRPNGRGLRNDCTAFRAAIPFETRFTATS
jgi:hypothetical protein